MLALAGCGDGVLRLWIIEKCECMMSLSGHCGAVWVVATDWKGLRAVSGSADTSVRLWDLKAGECIRKFAGHGSAVCTVVVSWGEMRAVSCARDGNTRPWQCCLHSCGILGRDACSELCP